MPRPGDTPGSRCASVVDRAQPVDTGVDSVCPDVHSGAPTGGRRTRRRAAAAGADDTREPGRTRAMADATVDLATVWDQIRERLATSLSPQQNAMLNLTRPVGVFEDTAVLSAPNEFTQTVLESRMRRVLAEALSEHLGRDIRVAVQVEDTPAEPEPPRPEVPTRRRWSAVEAQRAEEDRETRDRTDDGRTAFGVRTDVTSPLTWERDAAERQSPPE